MCVCVYFRDSPRTMVVHGRIQEQARDTEWTLNILRKHFAFTWARKDDDILCIVHLRLDAYSTCIIRNPQSSQQSETYLVHHSVELPTYISAKC